MAVIGDYRQGKKEKENRSCAKNDTEAQQPLPNQTTSFKPWSA
jgi:hypothetical protein